jgi:hypothetical protein
MAASLMPRRRRFSHGQRKPANRTSRIHKRRVRSAFRTTASGLAVAVRELADRYTCGSAASMIMCAESRRRQPLQSAKSATADSAFGLSSAIVRLRFPAVPNTPCPRCHRPLVRAETIVSKGVAFRHYYCGGCGYSWRVSDTNAESDTDDADKPDRSRPR